MHRISPPSSSRLQDAITVCDDMRPTFSTEFNSKESFDNLRSVLFKLSSTPRNFMTKKQLRSDNRRMEETIKEICSEIGEISTKLGVFASTLSSFVDKFQMLEDRIRALESKSNQTTAI